MNDVGRRLIEEVLQPMKDTFIGKDEIIDLMGICLVGGENLFMLGPPGTAKSALVHELSRHLEGETFEYLLTRFTEPNEIFGPFDITKLREGTLVTNTEGMLPEASLVFLDELLNANSAILNSLLGVLNERVFRRGREIRQLPTIMVIGASNRLPDDEALQALFDRFLMRVHCDHVPEEQLGAVVEAGWAYEGGLKERETDLSIEDVRRLSRTLHTVDLSPIRGAYVDLILRIRKAGIPVSDRRAVKLQRLTAASALLCGRTACVTSDMWICKHIWETAEQQDVLRQIVHEVIETCASAERHPSARSPRKIDPELLARELEALMEQTTALDSESVEMAQARDRLTALAARCEWVEGEERRQWFHERIQTLWTRFGEAS
ncbi:MAG: AAA family ATPase [Verrucomicrobiota bacterium]